MPSLPDKMASTQTDSREFDWQTGAWDDGEHVTKQLGRIKSPPLDIDLGERVKPLVIATSDATRQAAKDCVGKAVTKCNLNPSTNLRSPYPINQEIIDYFFLGHRPLEDYGPLLRLLYWRGQC